MHRTSHRWAVLRHLAATSSRLLLFSTIAVAKVGSLGTRSDPPGFHLLLRPEAGKTTFKLGEPITFEAACYSDSPQSFTAGCATDSLAFTGGEIACPRSRREQRPTRLKIEARSRST